MRPSSISQLIPSIKLSLILLLVLLLLLETIAAESYTGSPKEILRSKFKEIGQTNAEIHQKKHPTMRSTTVLGFGAQAPPMVSIASCYLSWRLVAKE
jgi:hypothetical protein